jgi:hypothetical protein
MTTPSSLSAIDTAVQELKLEQQRSAFTHKLGQIVGALGTIPDAPPKVFTAEDLVRLRELAEEAIEAVERRIESGGDDGTVQQRLAGTVYEVRKRMEVVELWFRHRTP